jgi:hypothetical protein
VRIPAKPITDSELTAITIPKDGGRRRSEATQGCSYHAEVIGIARNPHLKRPVNTCDLAHSRSAEAELPVGPLLVRSDANLVGRFQHVRL